MSLRVANQAPSVVVIDNFYEDPNAVRERALREYKYGHANWKGRRSGELPREEVEALRPVFERALGLSLDEYNIRSHFHIHDKDTPLVYHQDHQRWAGVIYLCPNAPVECGTSTFQSKPGVSLNTSPILDGAWWDEKDRVGNVYNRCILFNGHQTHSVSGYFGDTEETRRLVQLFFFDRR